MEIKKKKYKNILEFVKENNLLSTFQDSHLSPCQTLENYLNEYSDRDDLVDCLLTDVFHPLKFKVSKHKDWRNQTITFL